MTAALEKLPEVEDLPDDTAQLKRVITELLSVIEHSQRENDSLKQRLATLLRQRYGRRAEKMDPDQLLLFARELLAEEAKAEEAPESAPETAVVRKNGHGRKALPANLPREQVWHKLTAEEMTCPECGGQKEIIGEETTEQLEYQPASLKVIEHVREKCACPKCEGHVTTAAKPPQPIEKGLPGAGLLAEVVVSKYADHLPMYRLEGIFARHGMELARSTLCDWAAASAELLGPLARVMKEEVLKSHHVHTDDTPVPVQAEGKTKTGRIWVYLGDRDHPYTVYEYTANRKRDGPEEFLKGYEGYLQADAFKGYDGIYAPGKITEVACWAHARRKFYESEGSDATRAVMGVAWIKKLYEVEHTAEEDRLKQMAALPETATEAERRRAHEAADMERQTLRQAESRPVLEKFKEWLEREQKAVLPKSPIGVAIGYALGNWAALERYTEDGRLAIDNNAAERQMRRIAVGRKNWMFAGSDRGGETAAVLYSMIATCQRHDVEPWAYLRDVLNRVATHPSSRIRELLPDQWKALRAAPTSPA